MLAILNNSEKNRQNTNLSKDFVNGFQDKLNKAALGRAMGWFFAELSGLGVEIHVAPEATGELGGVHGPVVGLGVQVGKGLEKKIRKKIGKKIVKSSGDPAHSTEVRFASFLSGGFTTMAVMNPPEKKLEKRTSVHCLDRQK